MHRPDLLTNTDKKSALALQLRSSIVSGEILPGERLKEKALSEEFGCSRSTVREVFSILTSEGLLAKHPNAGVEVKRLSSAEILSAMEVRFALDMVAADSIIEDATGSRLAEVRSAFSEYKPAVLAENSLLNLQAHLTFHEAIWRASENEVLLQYWPLTSSIISLHVAQDSRRRGSATEDLETHSRLVDALATRNRDFIRQEFYAHTVLAAKNLLDRKPY